jgi:HSP20 family protein
MNLEKLKPWNWFKHEDASRGQYEQIPVRHAEAGALASSSGYNSLLRFQREMDHLFDDVFASYGIPSFRSMAPDQRLPGSIATSSYLPQIDVSGNADQYEVTLDVPGISESDLSIEVKGDLLCIKGQKEETKESNDKHFYRLERSFGSFQRTLSLPEDASADDIRARLHDGVLTLEIPRNQVEDKEVKRISITS